MDKNLKFYWCRTRVKGSKKLRNSEAFKESAEAQGTGEFRVSGGNATPTPADLGLVTGCMQERQKSEASGTTGLEVLQEA